MDMVDMEGDIEKRKGRLVNQGRSSTGQGLGKREVKKVVSMYKKAFVERIL